MAAMRLKPLHWLGLAIAALLGGLFVAAPASAQVNSRITCESWQFRYAQCPVPSIIDARISRVIAGDCRPGNWGYDRRGVWVNNGCRAVFDVASRGNGGGNWGGSGGSSGGGGGQIVRCESWQFQPARCNMDTRGGVRIQRVIAGDCRQNQTWGWDRNAVWVNGGCRADFVSGSGGGGSSGGNAGGGWGWGNSGGSGGGGQIVECSSWEYKPARCSVRVQNSVQLDRVNGGECVQGRTWGWDRNGIWVNDGCRARFRVY
jgi:hypothetical protein